MQKGEAFKQVSFVLEIIVYQKEWGSFSITFSLDNRSENRIIPQKKIQKKKNGEKNRKKGIENKKKVICVGKGRGGEKRKENKY